MKGVIGIDEVGRGPFAGPVTVCAVYLEDVKNVKKEFFCDNIRDSKKLSKVRRNNIYQTIRKRREINKKIIYVISSRSASHIDKNGINESIRQCLLSCMIKLKKKGLLINKIKINTDAGLVISLKGLQQDHFVKGDENYTEIAIASILAKEYRDNYMKRIGLEYKRYNWGKNAGYGTLEHGMAINKYGITKYHRKTYLKRFKLFDKTK